MRTTSATTQCLRNKTAIRLTHMLSSNAFSLQLKTFTLSVLARVFRIKPYRYCVMLKSSSYVCVRGARSYRDEGNREPLPGTHRVRKIIKKFSPQGTFVVPFPFSTVRTETCSFDGEHHDDGEDFDYDALVRNNNIAFVCGQNVGGTKFAKQKHSLNYFVFVVIYNESKFCIKKPT